MSEQQPQDQTQQLQPPKPPAITYKQFLELKKKLDSEYFGYDLTKLALILGLITGKPTLLIGDPGTAKTSMIKAISDEIEGIKEKEFFYALMNPYTREEEIFGFPNLKKLTQEGLFERVIEGFLPGAKIVFLDEIFKAPGELRTTLFNALNEKRVQFGSQVVELPWIAFYSASNEVDVREPQDIAFLDRFKIINFVKAPAINKSYPAVGDTASMLAKIARKSAQLRAKSLTKRVQQKLFKEDDIRALQDYVVLLTNFNAGKDADKGTDLNEFYALLGQVMPNLDQLDVYRAFYESISKDDEYISPRRASDLYLLANALAYLTGDDQPHYIHKGLAILLGVPVGFPVYVMLLKNLKDKFPRWLEDYISEVISSTMNTIGGNNDVMQLYKEVQDYKNELEEYDKLLDNLIKVLGNKALRDSLAFGFAYNNVMFRAFHPFITLVDFINSLYKAITNNGSISSAVSSVLQNIAIINDKEQPGQEEEQTLAYALGMLPLLNVGNVEKITYANNIEEVDRILGGEVDRFPVDVLKKLDSLSNISKRLEEINNVLEQSKNANVSQELQSRLDAINEFLLKPLLWAYGFDYIIEDTYAELKKIQNQLNVKSNKIVDDTAKAIDEVKKLIEDVKNKENALLPYIQEFKTAITNYAMKIKQDLRYK